MVAEASSAATAATCEGKLEAAGAVAVAPAA